MRPNVVMLLTIRLSFDPSGVRDTHDTYAFVMASEPSFDGKLLCYNPCLFHPPILSCARCWKIASPEIRSDGLSLSLGVIV